MQHPLVGHVDALLLCLALLVASIASYASITLIDPVMRSQGRRRWVWIFAAAMCFGFGIWSAECITFCAISTTVEATLAPLTQFQSFVDAVLLAGAAFLFAEQRRLHIRLAFVVGTALGLSICCSQLLSLAALQTESHIRFNFPLSLATVAVVFIASVAIMSLERIGRAYAPHIRRVVYSSAALFFGLIITGSFLSVLEHACIITPNFVAIENTLGSRSAAILLSAANAIVIVAVLAAAILDRAALQESARAHLYNDLYQRERNVNATLQQAFLPSRLPELESVEFSCVYLPQSEESRVGGDWYDAFTLDSGCIAISIGDVSGHGLSAALSMLIVRQAIRCAALSEIRPSAVLQRAHQVLKTSDYPAVVTAAFATLHPSTLELTYTFAGHPPAIVVNAANEVRRLEYGGLPLGVFDDLQLVDRTMTLEPGGLLVMYTDGCIEYDRDVTVGEQRLNDAIQSVHHRHRRQSLHFRSYAQAIARYLFADSIRRDDAALLCIAPRGVRGA
jgi:serine phosphatase RsbU (regulator of sigma subunit)